MVRAMPRVIQPESLASPRGYSNGLAYPTGETLFIAGQIGWDRDCKLISDRLSDQFDQALGNALDVVLEAGGKPEHVGRMTVYVTDKHEYLAATKAIGAAYRARMGKHYPAMSLVQVADLLEDGAKVEIELTAMLPLKEAP